MNILIPMAGLGVRFRNEGITTVKPLIVVRNKTLIEHAVESLGLSGNYIFVTRVFDNKEDNRILSTILKGICPTHTEIRLTAPTRGAAETCLSAVELIDNDVPLLITNCDQRMEWDSSRFSRYIKATDADGIVVTHESDDSKFCYITMGMNNEITSIREKQVISNRALVGIHYWKHGRDFVRSSLALIAERGMRECYVSETCNFLIKEGKKIVDFGIERDEFITLGIPSDVAAYESKIKL